jgi:hypothetical protein
MGDKMANEEQLAILKQDSEVLSKCRQRNPLASIDLTYAQLMRADLQRTNLQITSLRNANLTGADLRRANLTDVDLRSTRLPGTHWSKTSLAYASFTEVDLSKANELDDIRHGGSSSFSTDTFIPSKGQIPEVFLRGCGLPD